MRKITSHPATSCMVAGKTAEEVEGCRECLMKMILHATPEQKKIEIDTLQKVYQDV